jgi:hypothetical protein
MDLLEPGAVLLAAVLAHVVGVRIAPMAVGVGAVVGDALERAAPRHAVLGVVREPARQVHPAHRRRQGRSTGVASHADGVGRVSRAGALERGGAAKRGERHAPRALRLAAARVPHALRRDIPVVAALLGANHHRPAGGVRARPQLGVDLGGQQPAVLGGRRRRARAGRGASLHARRRRLLLGALHGGRQAGGDPLQLEGAAAVRGHVAHAHGLQVRRVNLQGERHVHLQLCSGPPGATVDCWRCAVIWRAGGGVPAVGRSARRPGRADRQPRGGGGRARPVRQHPAQGESGGAGGASRWRPGTSDCSRRERAHRTLGAEAPIVSISIYRSPVVR